MAEPLSPNFDVAGYAPPSIGRTLSPARIAEHLRLTQNADRLGINAWRAKVEEAVGASDFPILTQYVTQRDVIARYQTAIPEWRDYVKTGTIAAFTPAEQMWTTGIREILPKVPERGERKNTKQSELKRQRRVDAYGERYDVTWQSVVNDVQNALGDIPAQMARAARATEAYLVASALVSATAINSTLFSDTARAPALNADGTVCTDADLNPTVDNVLDANHDALSIANLEVAVEQLAKMEDAKGNPMGLRPRFLVVPPALELTAWKVLESAMSTTTLVNVIPKFGIQVRVNEYLPVINGTSGHTNWFLFADPAQGSPFEMTYLRGYEAPAVFLKQPNKTAAGGGGRLFGDFDTDMMSYAVQHVCGVNIIDPRFAIGSTGDTA